MDKHRHGQGAESACTCHGHEDHGHEDHGCGCCHGDGEQKGGLRAWLPFLFGGIPTVLSFLPMLPPLLRILLACSSYIYFGWSVFRSMLRGFRKGRIFTEFTLMCVATLCAFGIGEYADAAAVMYLYSLGEHLSDRAYGQSRRNLSELLEITPEYATVLREGSWQRVAPGEVSVGESILVAAGERIPLDGRVLRGGGEADVSSVTGEATPLELYEGVFCPSGSILVGGSVELSVTHSYESSVVSRLTQALHEATGRKSTAEKRISRFARVFTPIAFLAALLIFVLGTALTGDWRTWLYMGLVVLVISCPCSLVLSVPLTYYAGMGRGAAGGIVFRGGEVMDAFCRIRGIALDKTGTVTEAALSFDRIEAEEGVDPQKLLRLSYLVLRHSPHAAARAFCETGDGSEAGDRVTGVEILPGRGIRCLVDGHPVFFGNAALLREQGLTVRESGGTVIHGAREGKVLGTLFFSARPKEGAASAIEELRDLGVQRIALLSGDGADAVKTACDEVGIGEGHASLTPAEKLEVLCRIEQEEKQKERRRLVAFCGDGLNDSPVVAGAELGIAMGEAGSALTVGSADAVIMDDDLRKIPKAIRIAKKTARVAVQNMVLSLGIKVLILALGLVLLITTGQRLSMEIAIVADVGAAILTVLNALRAAK